MTQKTEGLEAWEAFKLLQEGVPVLKDAHGAEWYPEDLKAKSNLTLHSFFSRAPFRLVEQLKQEPEIFKSIGEGYSVINEQLLAFIRSEARKIAQEEIIKFKGQIEYLNERFTFQDRGGPNED